MTRQSRELSSTGIYHIMLRGNERKNVFQDSDDKQRFLFGIEEKQKDMHFSVNAYCLMDNHCHLLLNTNNQDMASIMKGIAVRYASFYNWKYSRVGHVFQDRYKSEPIEDDRYMLAVVRYIHNNPVKAGLVKNPEDYVWSSYSNYLRSKGNPWLDTNFVLSLFADETRKAIREFERFSLESDESTFLDCEDVKAIRSLEEGKAYFEAYLNDKGLNISKVKEDKEFRYETIVYLRSNTGLSQRVIADILGVDKGIVERVPSQRNKA